MAVEDTLGAARGGSVPTVFVGRDTELAELLEVLHQADAGAGSLVLVAGEAGVGKTRLVEEVARRAAGGVVWGRCWDGDGAPPFWPWQQVLRSLLAGPGGGELRTRTSADHLAEATRLLEERTAAELGADARFRVFDSLTQVLRAAAVRQRLLLVVDDLHSADEASLRLLEFLGRELPGSRLAVIATYRDTDLTDTHPLTRCLSELATVARHVTLGGLTQEELARLVRPALEHDAALDEVVPVLHRRTAGNPFFVQELVRLLRSERRLADVGRFRPSMPGSVRAVLVRRLARASQDTHEVLAAGAVLGLDFDMGLLAAVTGREPAELLTALGEAGRMRLVAEAPGTVGRFSFTHALVREVLYDELGVAVRAGLHRKAGEAMERLGFDERQVAELANHFVRAAAGGGDVEKAVNHATQAAARARRLLAHEEAAAWYERALELLHLQGPVDPRREGDVLLAQGECFVASGDRFRARDAHLRAAELARDLGGDAELAHAALGLGSGLGGFEVGPFDRTQIELLEAALAALPTEDSRLRARVLARLSVALSFVESDERRLALSEQAVQMARRVGDRSVLGYALAAHCDALAGPDHSETREREASEVIRLARGEDPHLELLGRRLLVVALLEQGRLAETDVEIDAFERVADRLREPLYRWYVPLWRGMSALTRGELEESSAWCKKAAEIGARAHSDNAAMLTAQQEWIRLRAQGRFTDASRLLEDAFAPYFDQAGGIAIAAGSRLQAGRIEDARPLVAEWADSMRSRPRDSEWLPEMATLAEAAVALDDPGLAEVVVGQLRPYANRFAVDGIGASVSGSVAWYLGRLCRVLGDDAQADAFEAHAGEAHARAGITAEPPPLVAPRQPSVPNAVPAAEPYGAALVQDGDTWVLTYAGRSARLRDSKGLRDLARLLARPGDAVHVADLAGTVTAQVTDSALDATAVAAYRARLADLEAEVAEAEANNDIGRVSRLLEEKDFLVTELAGSLGLGGRRRRPGDPVERARKAVTARLRDTIERITKVHPLLGRHLTNAVHTGTFCSYEPERPVTWQL